MISRYLLIVLSLILVCAHGYGGDDDGVLIPGGTYRSFNEAPSNHPYDEPSREIAITTFTVSRYPVTFKEYLTFVNDTNTSKDFAFYDFLPEYPVQYERGLARVKPDIEPCPAYNVTWVGAMKYLDWKSSKDPKNSYRLPTQFEFEYLASNGGSTRYPWGDKETIPETWDVTRYKGEYVFLLPIGSLPGNGNRWGVYDLIGSVDQWTSDMYHEDGPKYQEEGQKYFRFAKTTTKIVDQSGCENVRVTFGGIDGPGRRSWLFGEAKGLPTAYSYRRYGIKNNETWNDAARHGFRWCREVKK